MGFIRLVKARLLGRAGPSPLQPWRDLARLFRKQSVVAEGASWLFRAAPSTAFAATFAAALLVPSFVLGMTTSQGESFIARSIIELAHNLGLRVVAEGVEDEVTRKLLAEMGCDKLQGKKAASPKACEEFADKICKAAEDSRRYIARRALGGARSLCGIGRR